MKVAVPSKLPSFGTIEAHGWSFVAAVRESLHDIEKTSVNKRSISALAGKKRLTIRPDWSPCSVSPSPE